MQTSAAHSPAFTLPPRAGIGLKAEHIPALLDTSPALGFVEIHAENYMVDGGPRHYFLSQVCERYPLSIHGVGLSLGGATLDSAHIERLKTLLQRYPNAQFSEHLAWSTHAGHYLNDLLPLPYNSRTLAHVCRHIDQVQQQLGRQLLLENPSTYIEFSDSDMSEAQFISDVIARTGCGLLLDINNVYVSAINHQRDALANMLALPLHALGEVHLAGFSQSTDSSGETLLIDSHDAPVASAVWQLYQQLIAKIGPVPTLLERDGHIPALPILCAEAAQAQRWLDHYALTHSGVEQDIKSGPLENSPAAELRHAI